MYIYVCNFSEHFYGTIIFYKFNIQLHFIRSCSKSFLYRNTCSAEKTWKLYFVFEWFEEINVELQEHSTQDY